MHRSTLLLFLTLALACGDDDSLADGGASDTSEPDSTTEDVGSTDTSVDDSGADDGGAEDVSEADAPMTDAGEEGPCPSALPSGSCDREGLICEYGPRSCLATAECAEGTWLVATPDCLPPPEGGCPATREEAEGSPCAGSEGSLCDYNPNLLCTCTTCPDPYPICRPVDPPVWACEAPNADPECPPGTPLLGTACSMEEQICDYGCEAGRRRVCVDGVWTADSVPGGCPRSTRRAKRDIEYLDATGTDALAAAVASTRLATYEYTDPALAGRRRLGFIIEDQPASYSVDPERSQVDLYGYTSMLVAAVQSQQRQIEALESEIQQMRQALQER